MNQLPPKYALRFLRWFCREDYLEEIEGDLVELFSNQYHTSPSRANRSFWWQVIRHFRPDFIQSFNLLPTIYTGMFKNYFKVAWRNMLKQKLYATINLLGLTIGMVCFILISLYIQHELSYDTHHKKVDQVYRVFQQQKGNTFRGTDFFAGTPEPLSTALMETFPEVEVATTVDKSKNLLAYQDKAFAFPMLHADERFFEVFPTEILQGDAQAALKTPNSILLSQRLARKFFNGENPIGKTLLFDNKQQLTVKGVFENVPKNQYLFYEYILPIKNFSEFEYDVGRWGNNNYSTYVVLPKNYDYTLMEKKMRLFDSFTEEVYKNLPFRPEYLLQAVTDTYLYSSHINFNGGRRGDIRYVYLFMAIAFIILLLATINYMNLSTAGSIRRSREVGIRKVLGAKKQQLIGQLLGESFLSTFFSFILALGLVQILLPGFNRIMGQSLSFNLLGNPILFALLLLTAILIGGLSGLYPGFIMSGITPMKAFEGKSLSNFKNTSLRNFLIVIQFSAVIIFAVCTVVVYQQLQYIQTKKIGFNRDQIVYVPFHFQQINKNKALIRNELSTNPRISNVSVANNLPIKGTNQGIIENWEGKVGAENLPCYRFYVDDHFLDLYEMELIAGRNLSPDFPTDSSGAYLLNEAAVETIGWTPHSAIGKTFKDGKVIGVVKDFHFQPMDLNIEPLFLALRTEQTGGSHGNFAMKVQMDDLENTLAYIRQTFKKMAPNIPFEYHFLDDSFNRIYASEQRLGKTFLIFTFLAVAIACIGLFGLVSYTLVQRTREIGIRKVLGASAVSIVHLLSKDFIRLVAIAVTIAIPLAWFIMTKWLQGFAYRVEISVWVFLLVGALAIGIALATISLQGVRTAQLNPVKSLRQE